MPRSLEILRLDKGLTQEELSKLCGVPQSIISRIETGRQRHARPKTMKAIADALGVKVSDIEDFIPSPKSLATKTFRPVARYNETGGVAALPVSQVL